MSYSINYANLRECSYSICNGVMVPCVHLHVVDEGFSQFYSVCSECDSGICGECEDVHIENTLNGKVTLTPHEAYLQMD